MHLREFLLPLIVSLCLCHTEAFCPASFQDPTISRCNDNRKLKIPFSSGRFVRPFLLGASSTSSSSTNSIGSDVFNTEQNLSSPANNERSEMPWNDWQEWALKDNISKYRISFNGSEYVLWRSMVREVTELAGYDVEFVREMYSKYVSSQKNSNPSSGKETLPKILPLLDQFEFESMGGITGKVYGLAGIAQGATIQTPELINMESTVPKGYVLCGSTDSDGASNHVVAYELGLPVGQSLDLFNNSERYRMLGTLANAAASTVSNTKILEEGTKQVKNAVAGIDDGVGDGSTINMVANIGGATAILLSSATLFNALQHHLTVNVFWV